MNKLKSAIIYGCLTKLKPILIFYLIEYLCFALIMVLVSLCTGKVQTGSNGVEVITAIFLGVMGALSFKEDFKALIQNGYTRRYIYLSAFCSFLLISSAMGLFDCFTGRMLWHFFDDFTLVDMLYGEVPLLANWLWLTMLYVTFCSMFYLIALIVNKFGKTISLLIGFGFVGIILMAVALFRFVFSPELVKNIGKFVLHALGFMSGGTVNLFFPILTFLVIGTVFALISYVVIGRTELK